MVVKCVKGLPKFRVKTVGSGERFRFAFCDGKVVEVKKLPRKSGKK